MDVNTSFGTNNDDPFGFQRRRVASGLRGRSNIGKVDANHRSHPQSVPPTTASTPRRYSRNVSTSHSYSTINNPRGESVAQEGRYSNQPQHFSFTASDRGTPRPPTNSKENASPRRSNARHQDPPTTDDFDKYNSPLQGMPIVADSQEQVSPLHESPPDEASHRRPLPPIVPHHPNRYETETSRRQTVVSSSPASNSYATNNNRNSISSATSQMRFQMRQLQQQVEDAKDALEASERKHRQQLQNMEQQYNDDLAEWQERYSLLQAQRHEEDLEREERLVEREDELRRREAKLHSQQEDWNEFHQEEANRLYEEEERLRQQYSEREEDLTKREEELGRRVAELELQEEEFQARLLSWNNDHQQDENELEEKARELRQREDGVEKTKTENESIHRKLQQFRAQLDTRRQEVEQRELRLQKDAEALAKRERDMMIEMESRNASYEAKYGLFEEALKDLADEREKEEERLAKVKREQDEAATWLETIKADASSLQNEVEDARSKHKALEEQIVEHQNTLIQLKERIRLFLEEDRKCRRVAAERNAEAERNLAHLEAEIDNVREELSDARREIRASKDELSSVRDQIFQERQEWENERRNNMEKSERDSRQAFEAAASRVQQAVEEANRERDSALQTISERSAQIDALRSTLESVTKEYDVKYRLLRQQQEAADSIQKEYKEKLESLAKLEEDSNWEIVRLKSLRDSSEKRLRQSQLELESIRDNHATELQTLAEQLALVEAERDELENNLRGVQEQSSEETEKLWAVVSDLKGQIEEKDVEVQKLRSDAEKAETRAARKQTEIESSERERKSLMDDLETKVQQIEQRQEDMDQEGRRLAELQDRLRREEGVLAVEKRRIADSERQLTDNSRQLAQEKKEFDERVTSMMSEQRKDALRHFFDKPLRRDMELASAAFSKWVRVAMFHANQEHNSEETDVLRHQVEALEKTLKESHQNRESLEQQLLSITQRRDELEGIQRNLVAQLLSARDSVAQLGTVRAEKDQLEVQVEDFRRGQEELESASKRAKQLAQELQEKKAELDQRELDLNRDLEKCIEKQGKLDDLARKLSQRTEQHKKNEAALEERFEQLNRLESYSQKLEFVNGRSSVEK